MSLNLLPFKSLPQNYYWPEVDVEWLYQDLVNRIHDMDNCLSEKPLFRQINLRESAKKSAIDFDDIFSCLFEKLNENIIAHYREMDNTDPITMYRYVDETKSDFQEEVDEETNRKHYPQFDHVIYADREKYAQREERLYAPARKWRKKILALFFENCDTYGDEIRLAFRSSNYRHAYKELAMFVNLDRKICGQNIFGREYLNLGNIDLRNPEELFQNVFCEGVLWFSKEDDGILIFKNRGCF